MGTKGANGVLNQRGTTGQDGTMPVDDTAAAVIGTKLDLLKEDIGRRLDDHREDIRSMRSEMASNYVHHQAYQAEQKRQDDKIESVAADIVDLRTSQAALNVDLHGHIDRRFNEVGQQVKSQIDGIAAQLKEMREQSNWTWSQFVLIGTAFLAAVTAVVVALIGTH